MIDLLLRYAHFIGIMLIASMLVTELVLVKSHLSSSELKRLAFVDAIFGVAAVLTFLTGLTLWLWVGEPAGFYSGNFVFHIKVGLFVLIGLLSIYPTVFFIKHRNSQEAAVEIPRLVVVLIRAEVIGLVLVPILAVLMAQGHGLG